MEIDRFRTNCRLKIWFCLGVACGGDSQNPLVTVDFCDEKDDGQLWSFVYV